MKIHIEVNDDKIEETASVLRGLRIEQDVYNDTRFFPPTTAPNELQLGFFAAMVAVDHRTSTPLDIFEGFVDGEFFHGADLLYRLGKKVFDEDPEFYTPERLATLKWEAAKKIFSYNGKPLWDFKVRVFLLRDLGKKVLLLHDTFGKLFNTDKIDDFVLRLKIFRAYEDPVEKKPYLLAKFLYGRKLVRFKDKQNFEVAVDNHLSRIAIRLGIVKFDDYGFIEKQVETTWDQDIEIRMKIKEAWKKVTIKAGKNPFALDDYLWIFGRTKCLRENLRCKECIFREICKARSANKYWWEHKHTLTWYY